MMLNLYRKLHVENKVETTKKKAYIDLFMFFMKSYNTYLIKVTASRIKQM